MAAPRVGIKKALSSADAMIYRLELISARLQDPKPALAKVAEEFALMEKQRFMNRGRAPEFGINQEWKALSPYTIERRAREGGNPMDQPLLNRGFLARAASTPSVDYFGTKSLSIYIDVSNVDAQYNPKHENYGVFHQTGKNRPLREFVTITPQFVEIAAKILQFYVMEGKGSKAQEKNLKIPSNSSVKSKVEVQARSHELRVQRSAKAAEKRAGSTQTFLKNTRKELNQQTKEVAAAKKESAISRKAPQSIVEKTLYGSSGFSSLSMRDKYIIEASRNR